MQFSRGKDEEKENPRMWALVREFLKRFRDEIGQGKIYCRDIAGVDWSDVNALKAFWNRYEGRARTASLAVNNAYLRANRVEGGLKSYLMSARLLVLYARHNNGSCLPGERLAKNDGAGVGRG